MAHVLTLDIEVYDKADDREQGTYLVHLHDDVLWTDSLDDAVTAIKHSLQTILPNILVNS